VTRVLCGVFLLALFAGPSPAPAPRGMEEVAWLIGDWHGTGEGDPGTSTSERHIEPFLNGRYLRANGRSVYEKQPRNPKGDIHEELNVWSYDRARQSIVLRQFDTLGFVSTYVVDKSASSADRWVLVGESLENVPKGWTARYLYTRLGADEYEEVLELDMDGKGFKAYVTNRFRRAGS
jgi:hypothetical protein